MWEAEAKIIEALMSISS